MGRIKVKKVRVYDSLLDQARFVFNISPTKTIVVNDPRFVPTVRLNRKELRALERAGYVKAYKAFGERKFTDSQPQMYYVYEWSGPVDSDGRPTYDSK
jgi:hypothetical protein